MNKQRQAVYGMRRALLEGKDQKARILEIIEGILASFVDNRLPEKGHPSTWDWTGLETDILTQFGVKIRTESVMNLDRRQAEEEIKDQLNKKYDEKESMIGTELMRETERMIMLNVIDNQWKDHLLSMDHLKEGIGLRGYGQKDPLIEYKKESFVLFQDMMDRIEDETIRFLFFMQRVEEPPPGSDVPANVPYPEVWADEPEDDTEPVGVAAVTAAPVVSKAAQSAVLDLTSSIQRKKQRELDQLQFVGGEASGPQKPKLAAKKAGRNDPCLCGSGKKYKRCCGA